MVEDSRAGLDENLSLFCHCMISNFRSHIKLVTSNEINVIKTVENHVQKCWKIIDC